MPYFGEPVGRVKIQTTSKNSQRYYTTKRLIRDLLSNTPNCYVRGGELREYFIYGGMRDRSMRSGTKLAREIQLTDWSTAGNLSNRSSGVQIPRDICTRFGRYLYSTKCSWIIIWDTFRSQIAETFWLPYELTNAIDRRRSQMIQKIEHGSIFCDRLRSRSQDRRRSQKCVSI